MKDNTITLPTRDQIENMNFGNLKIYLNHYLKKEVNTENFPDNQNFIDFLNNRTQELYTISETIRAVWIKINNRIQKNSLRQEKKDVLKSQIEEIYKPLYEKVGKVLSLDYNNMKDVSEMKKLLDNIYRNPDTADTSHIQIEKTKRKIIKKEPKVIRSLQKAIDFVDSIKSENIEQSVA